jgi:hypothetical protein
MQRQSIYPRVDPTMAKLWCPRPSLFPPSVSLLPEAADGQAHSAAEEGYDVATPFTKMGHFGFEAVASRGEGATVQRSPRWTFCARSEDVSPPRSSQTVLVSVLWRRRCLWWLHGEAVVLGVVPECMSMLCMLRLSCSTS